MELVLGDNPYCIVTTSRISLQPFDKGTKTVNNSMIRESLLNPILKQTVGCSQTIDGYAIVNKSLKLFLEATGGTAFATKVATENIGRRSSPEGLKVASDHCLRFALLDRSPVKNAVIISHFVKNLLTSSPTSVYGYQLVSPYQIIRNFFHERLLLATAQLDASGIQDKFRQYSMEWFICKGIRDMEKKLTSKSDSKKASLRYRRCQILVRNGGSNLIRLMTERSRNSIRMEQLSLVLEVCRLVIILSLLQLIMEIVYWYVQNCLKDFSTIQSWFYSY